MTYIVTHFLLLGLNGIKRYNYRHGQRIYWCVLIALFVFSGFRNEVGCDWFNYLRNFELQSNRSFEDAASLTNPAHWLLISLIQQLNLSYQYLNVATSAIFFYGLHTLARRQPDPIAFLVLSFPILVLNMPMSAIKQAAAIGFVCIAYTAFLDRRVVKFVIAVALGSLFHSSAMIFFLLVPFTMFPVTRYSVGTSVLMAVPGIFAILSSSSADLAVSRYVGTSVDAFGAQYRLALLALTGAAFFVLVRRRWRYVFPNDYQLVFIGAGLMIAMLGLLLVSSVIGDRFGYYLIPIQLMIFARLPYLFLRRGEAVVVLAPYAVLTAVLLVWTQMSDHFYWCYVPYQMGI